MPYKCLGRKTVEPPFKAVVVVVVVVVVVGFVVGFVVVAAVLNVTFGLLGWFGKN